MLGMAEKGLQLHSSRQQQQQQQQQHTCSRHLNGLETRITSPPTTSPCNKKGVEVSQSSGMMMATLPPGCGRSPSAAPSPRACPCKGKSPPKTSKKGQQQHRQMPCGGDNAGGSGGRGGDRSGMCSSSSLSSNSSQLPILKRLQRLSAASPASPPHSPSRRWRQQQQQQQHFQQQQQRGEADVGISVIHDFDAEAPPLVLRSFDTRRLEEKHLLNSEEDGGGGCGGGGGGGGGSLVSGNASYIPSPIGSPSAARRSVQRLGDRICSSPILSRVRRRLGSASGAGASGGGAENGGAPSPATAANSNGGELTHFAPPPAPPRRGLCGLLSGLTGGGGGGDWEHGNIYLWSGGDTGRIANRHQEDRWDVWTTMGEDMWIEYGSSSEEETSDDEESDSEEDDSEDDEEEGEDEEEDDFLRLPLDDKNFGRR